MTKRSKQIVAALLVAVPTGGAGYLIAQNVAGQTSVQQQVEPTVKGVVKAFNLNADGEPNGLLIAAGEGPLVQVNFPPHMSTAIGQAVKAGTSVTVETRPVGPKPPRPEEDDRPAPPPPPPATAADHPVAELVKLTPDGGEAITVVRPDEMPTKKVEGTIARLNYAREGQVDGAVLEDGTLVHVGPKEAADLNLAVGQKITAEGNTPPKASKNVIHATNVNGTAIERPAPKKGPKPPKPPM